MRPNIRFRTSLFAVAGILSAALSIATLIWHDWAEILFGIEPDNGSGWFEFGVSAAIGGIALVALALAFVDLRRSRASVHRQGERHVV
jgi:hypothetical protein